eukprot:gene182-158_t
MSDVEDAAGPITEQSPLAPADVVIEEKVAPAESICKLGIDLVDGENEINITEGEKDVGDSELKNNGSVVQTDSLSLAFSNAATKCFPSAPAPECIGKGRSSFVSIYDTDSSSSDDSDSASELAEEDWEPRNSLGLKRLSLNTKKKLSHCMTLQDLQDEFPDVIRSVNSRCVMRNFGRLLHREDEVVSNAPYELSTNATETGIDVFISHSWHCNRWEKTLTLYMYFNVTAAVFMSLMVFVLTYVLMHFAVQDGAVRPSTAATVVSYVPVVAFFFTVLFRHSLTPSKHNKGCFLDKCCIHQTDDKLRSVGIYNLANFIRVSDKFLVLWSPEYFERLWCVYEMGSFFHFKTLDKMQFFPVYRSMIFFSIIGFCAGLCLICDVLVACNVDNYLNDVIDQNSWSVSLIMVVVFAFIYFACLPFWVFSIYPKLVKKSRKHLELEKQLRKFKCDNAKCHLESDRNYIYNQIVKWFKPTAQLHKLAKSYTKELDEIEIQDGDRKPSRLSMLAASKSVSLGGVKRLSAHVSRLSAAASQSWSVNAVNSKETLENIIDDLQENDVDEQQKHVICKLSGQFKKIRRTVSSGLENDAILDSSRVGILCFERYINTDFTDSVLKVVGRSFRFPLAMVVVALLPLTFRCFSRLLLVDNSQERHLIILVGVGLYIVLLPICINLICSSVGVVVQRFHAPKYQSILKYVVPSWLLFCLVVYTVMIRFVFVIMAETTFTPTVARVDNVPKNYADRFVPSRHTNNENTRFLDYRVEVNNQYESVLADNLLGANRKDDKVLRFSSRAPEAPVDSSGLGIVCNKFEAAKAVVGKPTRVIPSAPVRALDAPGLVDDYYSTPVDWSSQNVVAIALGGS